MACKRFLEADFQNTELSFAFVEGANLYGSNLNGCDFYGANV